MVTPTEERQIIAEAEKLLAEWNRLGVPLKNQYNPLVTARLILMLSVALGPDLAKHITGLTSTQLDQLGAAYAKFGDNDNVLMVRYQQGLDQDVSPKDMPPLTETARAMQTALTPLGALTPAGLTTKLSSWIGTGEVPEPVPAELEGATQDPETGIWTKPDAYGGTLQGVEVSPGEIAWMPLEITEPEYLGGFPAGYSVERETAPETVAQLQRLYAGQTKFTRIDKPEYNDWDNYVGFAGKDPVYLNQIQYTLYESGVLDKDDMTPGFWGRAEALAMGELMVDANANATTWQEVAAARIAGGMRQKKETAGGTGPKAQPFVQQPYLQPDYDNLASAVRRTVTSTIGRQPEDWELALLAEKLNQDYRAQYEAETAANRAYHDAGNRALLSDTDQTSGEVQDVDPLGSLAETVYQRYRQEIDFGERKEEHAYSVQRMMSNLAGIEQMVGGL